MMSKTLINKLISMLCIMIALFVLQNVIMSVVSERSNYKKTVIKEIVKSSSDAQKIIGPVLVIPYQITERTYDTQAEKGVTKTSERAFYVLPENLKISAKNIDVTTRNINIYQAQVYKGEFSFAGVFREIDFNSGIFVDPNVTLQKPYVAIALGDTRGINNLSSFMLNGNEIPFSAGGKHKGIKEGLHAAIEANLINQFNEFAFSLSLQGTDHLSIIPVGKTTEVTLNSNWAHPSFIGAISPETRTVRNDGFSANWKSTWYANKINTFFEDDSIYAFSNELPSFSVGLVDLVDNYQLNIRSIKYAILFIGLTFVGFFLFEVMREVRVHPIQYALVGIALIMFYLILLAFSEFIGFTYSYILATSACCTLIGFYLVSILKGLLPSLAFTSGFILIYGMLYIILTSEGNALLLGTIFLFITLGLIMFITRKVDWYQLTDSIDLSKNSPSKEF